jgi:hypothetical protein
MYLQASSAATLLDLPVSTFYQLVREGILPPSVSKVGKHRLWSREQLVAAVDPRGYKPDHVETPPRHPPSGSPQRKGPLLLAPRAEHPLRRATGKAAGRSPYAGILGGSGDGSPILGGAGSGAARQDR